MICKHFNQETVGDLIDITHGRLFKRSDFLSKSIDYLIQMAYISQQFQITSLKIMMDHCIYIKTVWDQMSGYHIDTLTKGLKYTIKTQNGKLLRLFWKIIHLIDFDRDSNEYQQIRKVFEDHDPLLLAVFDAKDDEWLNMILNQFDETIWLNVILPMIKIELILLFRGFCRRYL